MNQESRKAEIEGMLEGIEDEKVKAQVTKALNYIGDPSRRLIVTYGSARSRESGYKELALKLAQFAYEQNPEDPYFLLELCNCLGQPQEVVNEIEQYSQRVDLNSLPGDQRAKVIVTLADGYKGAGKISESIQTLEESKTELARGIELLAELYYQTGQPQKAIDLLYERLKWMGKLSQDMAFWMAKSFDTLGDYSQALEKLEKFKDDASIKPIYNEARRKLGLPVESEGIPQSGGSSSC
ncbi:MAG: hypothetical protein IBX36_04810 [Dehalococcoidia bacterium]|nr:hypothetical protein [Dehalococcoidia bacterium]